MATYYSSPNNQRESAPILYSREQIPTSYPEASVLSSNMMIYMNSESYSDALAANSQQQSSCIEMPPQPMGTGSDSASQQQDILSNLGGSRMAEHEFSEWREGKNDLVATHSMSAHTDPTIVHGGQSLHCGQGLSLSLGTQIHSGIQMPSISFRNPNLGFSSFLSPNSSRDEQSRNVEYLASPGFGDQDSNKAELSPYGMSSVARAVPSSKYLKAAQQLLDEVVNVRKALKQHDSEKTQSGQEQRMKSPKEGEDGSKSESTPGGGDSSAGNSQAPELSHTEKQDLQNKLTKLLSMLDEVDRRYKQYYHQMQIVVSSFDAIAGGGSAKPYTALALQTISRHFRCLRDAITGQIKATRKSLGEDDASGSVKGVGISRLRFVDQQLRQQRALQQLGMMQQHAWRPQRGLPESSVSVLRAWLFEHFLHPYPKDSDKIMLARQTGLTRSQVSNWFINARVRLWKPMVEEMYKEETGDADMDSNSSSENAAKVTKGGGDEDKAEDLQQQHQQQSASSTGTERCSTGPFMDPPKSDHVPPDVQMVGGSVGSQYGGLMMMKPRREDCSLYPDANFNQDGGNSEHFMAAAAAAYHMPEMGRFGGGGVSLTLGLQHCEGGAPAGGASMPMSGAPQHHHHHGFIAMRGHDEIYNGGAASSVGPEGPDFEQPRFASSSHLLHDFVV